MPLLRCYIVAFMVSVLCVGTGCGGAATDDWNNYQNAKTAKARAGFEAGIALHEKYMAVKRPICRRLARRSRSGLRP